MPARTAPVRTARRPVTAADLHVAATLPHFFADCAVVTVRVLDRGTCVLVASVSCDLRGLECRVLCGTDFRHRDGQADEGSLRTAMELAAPAIPAAVIAAVARAVAGGMAKADELDLELDAVGAAKIRGRCHALVATYTAN